MRCRSVRLFQICIIVRITKNGSGVELSPEEILTIFKSLVDTQRIEGWSALQGVITAAKTATRLRWAPPLDVKNAADRVFTEKFGPKEAQKPKPKVGLPPSSVLIIYSQSV